MSRVFSRRALVACLLAFVLSPARGQDATAKPAAPTAPSKFEAAIKDAKKVEGLWTVYYKDQQILVDLKNSQLNQDYIVLSSIARGVSVMPVYGGMTWGDDVLWSFRKVGDKMHVLRKNVRFKAKPGSPEAAAVKMAYSDSVLYALPVIADTGGGSLVDMTRVFLSDDERIGQQLRAAFAMDRSTVSRVKAFEKNVEIDIVAIYSGNSEFDTIADSRGMQVGVHYSISQLPSTGYKPRKADDRVGYFLTVAKDFTDNSDDEHFVRYINRWDLQKTDGAARLMPPKKPITFYLEKTVPFNLRPIVREGIEEWNKAYETLGFANAIEVLQQRDEDTWDPEDVHYNTFRWITAEAGFAMGPSRVNPLTGQILDADIIFDASFLRSWRHEYENFTPSTVAMMFGDDEAFAAAGASPRGHHACRLATGMQQQMGFAAAALLTRGLVEKRGELPEEFLQQALKEVVMHEVGHTLGLRHNFKASSWKSLAEIEDANKAGEAIVASVMDYSPVNVNPPGSKQSAYYTKTIGPYDHWAIEYGYKVISGDENAELAKIASRSGEPGLDYATDEDTRGSMDPDPMSNRFDLGKDPVAYAQRQITVTRELLPKILERSLQEGDGYQRARQAFMIVLGEGWRASQFAARIPGGVEVRRDHKGDANNRLPFQVMTAQQQRAAVKLLLEQPLNAPTFDPQVLNSLASTRWYHWGITQPSRIDFPVHDTVARLYSRITVPLLSATTMQRLLDGELKVKADEDAYTLAEHLKTLVDGIFSEYGSPAGGEYTNRKPFVSTFRRPLQRGVLEQLTDMVSKDSSHPEDARVLVRMYLGDLKGKMEAALAKEDLKLDDYSKAHTQDSVERIKQVLEGRVIVDSGSGGAMIIRLGREPGTPAPTE